MHTRTRGTHARQPFPSFQDRPGLQTIQRPEVFVDICFLLMMLVNFVLNTSSFGQGNCQQLDKLHRSCHAISVGAGSSGIHLCCARCQALQGEKIFVQHACGPCANVQQLSSERQTCSVRAVQATNPRHFGRLFECIFFCLQPCRTSMRAHERQPMNALVRLRQLIVQRGTNSPCSNLVAASAYQSSLSCQFQLGRAGISGES